MPAWRNWQTRWTQNPVAARSCGFEPLRRQRFSFDVEYSAFDGNRSIVWTGLEKNASRPIRTDHQLCSPDTFSARLPVSSKSHLDWDLRRSLRWQCLPAMEERVLPGVL